MNRNEFWLGVCVYTAILLASFSGSLYPLMNKPLLSVIETFWHSRLSANHGSFSPIHLKSVPVREELSRG
jgi:hypothetical protein